MHVCHRSVGLACVLRAMFPRPVLNVCAFSTSALGGAGAPAPPEVLSEQQREVSDTEEDLTQAIPKRAGRRWQEGEMPSSEGGSGVGDSAKRGRGEGAAPKGGAGAASGNSQRLLSQFHRDRRMIADQIT